LSYVLSHLRRRRFLTPYQNILTRTGHRLEHPLVTRLHTTLVLRGDFAASVDLLKEMAENDMFEEYLKGREMKAEWKRLCPLPHCETATEGDAHVSPSIPCARGGHAMCLDPSTLQIYLLGGYTGQLILADFWVYSITSNKWTLLSDDTEKEKNGPGRRCCHKMVWDEKGGCIYLLGRLVEGNEMGVDDASIGPSSDGGTTAQQSTAPSGAGEKTVSYCSEFHRYHTRGLDAGGWDLLTFDTAVRFCFRRCL
jgi:hypothetical protein